MISLVSGLPGSGKTTTLARCCKLAVAGRPVRLCGQLVSAPHKYVYTNFPFPGAYRLDADKLGEYNYKDCFLVVDEAMLHFDNRDYKSFNAHLKRFFATHRHGGNDCLLANQAAEGLDKKIRDLTANLYHCTMLPLGVVKVTAILPYFGLRSGAISTGYEYGRSQLLWGKALFRLFDSFCDYSDDLPPPPLVPWDSGDFGDPGKYDPISDDQS